LRNRHELCESIELLTIHGQSFLTLTGGRCPFQQSDTSRPPV
jgi:hypothetical protein